MLCGKMINKNILTTWFKKQRGEPISVVIAGRIFGGRHGESPQIPQQVEFRKSQLIINFATTEVLTVANPSDFILGKYDQLIIPWATRATFGWHYYGLEQTPENWGEELYELEDGIVRYTCTGSLLPGTENFEYTEDKFIELL